VNDSGVARRCADKVATYIQANGFSDETAKNLKVNGDTTADALLKTISKQLAYFDGFSLLIGRDSEGQVNKITPVPFQCVRRKLSDPETGADGGFEVNLTYGQKKFDAKESVYYPAYKGQLTKEQYFQIYPSIQQGEILYAYLEAIDNSYYPNPAYYAQIEDIRTTSELAKFDFETITNGFITSAILTYIGNIDDKQKDERGKTERDYINEQLAKFTGNVKDSDGVSGRNRLLVMNVPSAEQAPTLQPFDSKAIFEASNTKRDIVERAVCRLFGVHPVLVGFSDAAMLGNTQSIANASLELNKNVQPHQNLITETFKKLYPAQNWALTEYTPVQYIEPSLYQFMSEEEIRGILLNLPPRDIDTPTAGQKMLDTLNSLSPLLATKVIDLIPKDKLLEALGLPSEPDAPQTPPNNGTGQAN
jgi:hypothetical protein